MPGKRYLVTGQYVTFKTMTANGLCVLGFYRGAPVPDDAEPAAIEHHLKVGLIEEVPDKAAPVAAPVPGDRPGSTGQGVTTQPAGGGKDAGGGQAAPGPAGTGAPAKPAQGGKDAPAKGKTG